MAVRRPPFAVPVFVAVGADVWGLTQELRGDPDVRLVATPRHASVLLVGGTMPGDHRPALDQVHDQLPHPRGVVSWRADPPFPAAHVAVPGSVGDVVAAVAQVHRAVMADPSSSSTDRLADREPHPWRGVGPHGQGGEGMMGGRPYGRPMAMTAPARDGLELDVLHLQLGPFHDALPGGMTVHAGLQGDVVTDLDISLAMPAVSGAPGRVAPAAATALRRELWWLAHALHVHGLDADAARAARLASEAQPGVDLGGPVRWLQRRFVWSGLRRSLRGVGAFDGRGDACSRWEDRLQRMARSAAGELVGPVAVSADEVGELADGMVGLTWGDVVRVLVSLDIETGWRTSVAA